MSRVIEVLGVLKARKAGAAEPVGSPDGRGRWYPEGYTPASKDTPASVATDGEAQACCLTIRPPTSYFPLSLYVHCKTAGHVARLGGVERDELEALLRQERKALAAADRG